MLFCTSEIKLHFAGDVRARKGRSPATRGVATSSVLLSHYSSDSRPVSGELLQEKALRSVLFVPRRGTKDASGEFSQQACPRLAVARRWHGLRRGTSVVGLLPKLPSAPTRGAWSLGRPLRSAAVQLERLAPALPVYWGLPLLGHTPASPLGG